MQAKFPLFGDFPLWGSAGAPAEAPETDQVQPVFVRNFAVDTFEMSIVSQMLANIPNSENQQEDAISLTEVAEASPLLSNVGRLFPLERWSPHNLIVAVSGGADSVALASALVELQSGRAATCLKNIRMAHCNYGLRGDESDEDETFVRNLAAQFGLAIDVWKAPPLRKPGGIGWEAHLRELRYQFFLETARTQGARYVVVGHTLDDQLETIVLRLLRGTSLTGLAGMKPFRQLSAEVTLARPLLNSNRAEVLQFLRLRQMTFRTDSSNRHVEYARNRVRLELIPYLNRSDPGWDRRLVELAAAADGLNTYWDTQIEPLRDSVRVCAPNRVVIDCRHLTGFSPLLVTHWLRKIWRDAKWPERQMTSRHWTALRQLAQIQVPRGPNSVPLGPTLEGNTSRASGECWQNGRRAESELGSPLRLALPAGILAIRRGNGELEICRG